MDEIPSLYLDVCCLNRPLDDPSQERVRLEAEAVTSIFSHIVSGEVRGVGSEALDLELGRTADPEKRRYTLAITTLFREYVSIDSTVTTRALQLESEGFHDYDALHLACAEGAGVHALLTTDDRFLRRATRLASRLNVRVLNPIQWLQETNQSRENDDENR